MTWVTVCMTQEGVEVQAELKKQGGLADTFRYRASRHTDWIEPQGLSAAGDYQHLARLLIHEITRLQNAAPHFPEPSRADVLALLTTTKLEDHDED